MNPPHSRAKLAPVLLGLLASLLLLACGSGAGPEIDGLEDRVAAVGSELVIEIRASNEGGGEINFAYESNASIASDRGGLAQRPGGSAIFTWTPRAEDIGVYTFDFKASDASGHSTKSITIEVKSAIGADSLPVFRRPLGAGTALDIATDDCIEIEILIEDQDSFQVTLSEEEPRIQGAELVQDQNLRGQWRWCPTKEQKAAQDRYLLTIGADDGDNSLALKHYQIILRDSTNRVCPGEPPEIRHTAANIETANGIVLDAVVDDDIGLHGAVSLYYSESRPSDPPDLSSMILAPMELTSGSVQSGTWNVTLPNPVVDEPPGAQTQLFYTIIADDNDDKVGSCDHSTSLSFEMFIVNAGGSGELGLCEPCTSDRQCGGDTDLCLPVGPEAEPFCFTACEDDSQCSTGYLCSPQPLTSADGNSGRQCIPEDESCSELSCDDDILEQNDGISQTTALSPGTLEDLRMCPFKLYAADEDWFEITLEEDSEVNIEIAGADDPNINLRLLGSAGDLVAVSEDFGSTDSLSRCLPAGTYYLSAYSHLFYKTYAGDELQDMGNDYSLTYTRTASQCAAQASCTDDVFEDDDALGTARIPDFGGLNDAEWHASGNQICSGDQDWYYISAYNNLSHISASITFTQSNLEEDLDILIYDGAGTLITQCTNADPTGCTNNGQSGDSNEHLTFQPPPECSIPFACEEGLECAPCDYYVVVNGFAGAENSYDLCLAYGTEDACL
ncbi:MAG: hypothetical protein GY811_13115 [Myxococcales bacterium]|nr:hypothetical protein [Myxococcales bacterium]